MPRFIRLDHEGDAWHINPDHIVAIVEHKNGAITVHLNARNELTKQGPLLRFTDAAASKAAKAALLKQARMISAKEIGH